MQRVNAVLVGKDTDTLATQIACVDTARQFQIRLIEAHEAAEYCAKGARLQNTVLFISGEHAWAQLKDSIRALSGEKIPLCFVLLSSNNDACEAFDLGVLDFLLFPLINDRLQTCLSRITGHLQMLRAQQNNDKLDTLLRQRSGGSLNTFLTALENGESLSINELCSVLFVKTGTSWIRLNLNEILWFEAAGDYVCIYTRTGSHVVCRPLKYFEMELCGEVFIRISRSVIVNLSNVKGFASCQNGGLKAQIDGDFKIKVGRRYRPVLDTILSHSNAG